MHIATALLAAREILANNSEAEMLLAASLGRSREDVFSHPEAEVAPELLAQFYRWCEQRRGGMPLAYLTHHREFYGLDFYVDEGVFIPRPETELLVEETIRLCRGISRPRLCDVGTGSGCIAIALAKHLPRVHIVATDISESALGIAKKNAALHGVSEQIEFVKSDLLAHVLPQARQVGERLRKDATFDAVVTNLPYVGTSENCFVSREVADFEPAEALFGGETGLELFERLFQDMQHMLRIPHFLIAECGFSQKTSLAVLIKKYFGNAPVSWKNDLAGLPRMCTICLKNSTRSNESMKNSSLA